MVTKALSHKSRPPSLHCHIEMPISKVPLVHKFGIISLSEAERTIRQRRLQEHKTSRKSFVNRSTSCPVITVDFITKYNSCSEIDREELNSVLKRVLEHAKYKSCHVKEPSPSKASRTKGDRTFQAGVSDLDVSEGWLELIMICQCCGTLQEESLISLVESLSLCKVSPAHIPALFYISGLCYYWLKTETAPAVLRSGELLLLKVLHRVSLRLYLHHLTSDLQEVCSPIEAQQLKFDLEGFEKCEKTYNNFPEALLHWRVAMEVGSLICDKYSNYQSSLLSSQLKEPSEDGRSSTMGTATPTTSGNVTQSSSICSGSSSGHCLSPILWHALDVWQCNVQEPSAMPEAIKDLLTCNINFNTQHWLEGLLAMEVLSCTAQSNKDVLHLLQSLAAGSFGSFTSGSSPVKDPAESDSSMTKPPSLSKYITSEECSLSIDKDSYNGGKAMTAKNVITLNVLGVQPTFVEPETESEFTSYTAIEEEEREEDDYDEFEDDGSSTKRTHNNFSPASVTTQALIDTESIPDTPLSTHSTEFTSAPYLSITNDSLNSLSELKITSATMVGDFSGGLDSQDIKDSSGFDNTDTDISLYGKQGHKKSQKKVTLVSLPQTPVSPVTDSDEHDLSSSDHEESAFNRVGLLDDRFELISVLKRRATEHGTKSVTLAIPSTHRADSRCTHFTHSTAPFSWVGGGVLGSQAPESTVYQQSILSLSQSIGSDENTSSGKISIYCFNQWPVEVQLVYVLNMGDVVIRGCDSSIQRMALLGVDGDPTTAQFSLIRLSGYESTETHKPSAGQSWYVRHCVVLSLSRVCHHCKGTPTQDGMSEIAWDMLHKRMSLELEPKVLEAHKLHQSCSFKSVSQPNSSPKSFTTSIIVPSLIDHIASDLSSLFLPDITYDFFTNKKSSKTEKSPLQLNQKKIDKTKIKSKVNTRRPTIQTKPQSYVTRTSCALNKIAEKHWELQMKQEDERERIG